MLSTPFENCTRLVVAESSGSVVTSLPRTIEALGEYLVHSDESWEVYFEFNRGQLSIKDCYQQKAGAASCWEQLFESGLGGCLSDLESNMKGGGGSLLVEYCMRSLEHFKIRHGTFPRELWIVSDLMEPMDREEISNFISRLTEKDRGLLKNTTVHSLIPFEGPTGEFEKKWLKDFCEKIGMQNGSIFTACELLSLKEAKELKKIVSAASGTSKAKSGSTPRV